MLMLFACEVSDGHTCHYVMSVYGLCLVKLTVVVIAVNEIKILLLNHFSEAPVFTPMN